MGFLTRAAGVAALSAYYYAVPARIASFLGTSSRLVGLQCASVPLVYLALYVGDQSVSKKTGVDMVDMEARGHQAYRARWQFWNTRKARATLLAIYRRMGRLPARAVFQNKTVRMGVLQRLKMSIVCVTLFPVRAALLLLSALAMLGFSKMAVLFGDDNLPPKGIRRLLQKCIYMTFRVAMLSMGFWHIREKGRRATVEEAAIIVPNHSSFVDMCIGYLFEATGVSKLENAKLPILGTAFRAGQMILVDRASPSSREDTKAELVRRATESGWPATVIFPEGTCSNNCEALLAFKAGPFTVGKPVQPVAVRYPHSYCDPSFVRGGPGLPYLLLRLMLQFANVMEVTYLPPHVPTPEEIEKPMLFASAVADELSEELGVTQSSFSYYDVALMDAARKKHRLPTLTSVPGFKMLRKECPSLTLDFAKKVLARFAAISSVGQNRAKPLSRITAEQVSAFASLHGNAHSNEIKKTLVRLFQLADEEGCGDPETGMDCSLGFRQVLVLVCLLRAAVPNLDKDLPANHILRREGTELCKNACRWSGSDFETVGLTAYSLLMGS